MLSFNERWLQLVEDKKSCLCVGIDPANSDQRSEMFVESQKLDWVKSIVEEVADYCSAIKLNRQYYKDFSRTQMQELNQFIHARGLLSIDDSKIADIGSTNDAALYHSVAEGFDAITYAPFPGNIEETAGFAKQRGIALIMLVLMSNPEFGFMKTASFEGQPAFEFFASQASKFQVDGVVIGAPSAKNHIQQKELESLKNILTEKTLILVPGIGAQGGDWQPLLNTFGKRCMINVGRSIIYADNPRLAAKRLHNQMLDSL